MLEKPTTQTKKPNKSDIETVIGRLYSFMNSLKLFHWSVTGEGSYAKHMALDEAIEDFEETLDELVETTFAHEGSINITIPETTLPRNIIDHCKQCYSYVDAHRKDFPEVFTQSVIDNWQQANKELQYRLIRLQ
jgi:DNA-binding ferritin-like protein